MLIPWIALLVCLVGLLVFVLASNGKVSEAGKVMFWVGLLVTLAVLSRYTIALGR